MCGPRQLFQGGSGRPKGWAPLVCCLIIVINVTSYILFLHDGGRLPGASCVWDRLRAERGPWGGFSLQTVLGAVRSVARQESPSLCTGPCYREREVVGTDVTVSFSVQPHQWEQNWLGEDGKPLGASGAGRPRRPNQGSGSAPAARPPRAVGAVGRRPTLARLVSTL